MKRTILIMILLTVFGNMLFSQDNNFEKFNFLLGIWEGTGSGFGNEKSTIQSEFQLIMNGKYIEIKNNSKFEPTESKPNGENHIDWGIISYNKKSRWDGKGCDPEIGSFAWICHILDLNPEMVRKCLHV